jgi:hypothetical protein
MLSNVIPVSTMSSKTTIFLPVISLLIPMS